ncbi:MAG: cobalamin-dependent protein [Dehalococcoidia bacterium]|nr:cobalamin-dependent protein [Dehalococcoidia bacterium]
MTAQKKPIKVLMAKTSLDAHWRGPVVVSSALRDAGMEVIFGGRMRYDEIANTAIQEDVDVIGLNIGGRYGQIEDMIKILRANKADDKLIIAGGTVPAENIPMMKAMGVAEVFPPESDLDAIVKFVQDNVKK